MADFVAFMGQRQAAISSGKIGHTRKSVSLLNSNNRLQCHYIAKEQAKADPSDPFAYSRVLSHMLDGTSMRGDYEVEFHKEKAWSQLDPKAEIVVQRPRNRKVPCT